MDFNFDTGRIFGGIQTIDPTDLPPLGGVAGVLTIEGTGALLLPTGTTLQEPTGATGMIRVNNDTPSAAVLEYYNGTVWTQVAGTSALQTEINNIETSLGGAIDSSGNFVPAGFSGPVIVSATSFTDAIQQVADYVEGNNTLDEIFPSTANGNVIYSAGGVWVQDAPGATSGVQPYDAGLTALAAKTSTGIMVQTAADTYASRTLVAPVAGFSITDPDGIAGNPTFALTDDLAALEGLTTTGYIVRTGSGTATTRSIDGTAGNIVVTNGDGVSTDTNINLDTVSQAATGNFVKVTLDSFGRVTGNTAVVTADITALVDGTYVNITGDTMSGVLNMGGNNISGVAEPILSTDAATKNYVDNAISGLSWKQSVYTMSTTNVNIANPGTDTFGGHTLTIGQRLLLTGQTTSSEDGIYIFDTTSTPLVRSPDANTYQELNGAAVFVEQGTYADTGWVQTATLTSLSSPQTWVQFSGSGAYVGGTGIDITGNVISANLGAGIVELPSDEIGIDLFAPSTGALILTSDGTTRSTNTGDKLYLMLDTSGALAQTASGLKINAASVTNAMLVNQGIGLNADTGTSSLDLGQTLIVAGDSVQGINTSVSGQTVTITASNASSSQKGVATFNTASFDVTGGGDVTIKTAGVSNAQLAYSSITVTGTSGSDAVALGESLAIIGADSAISTTMGANSLSIQLNTVDVPHGGTGRTTLATGQLLFGAGTSQVGLSSALSFDGTATLTVGTATIQGGSPDVVITATGTNGNINLVPNGTGLATVNGDEILTTASDYVSQIVAGTNVTISPISGLGVVTINADGAVSSIIAGTGISVSSPTGNVTISNTGVTSVALSDASTTPIYSISGSPVTTTGTLTQTLVSQTAHSAFLGPLTGSAQPTFRAIEYSDLPIELYKENPTGTPVISVAGTNGQAFGDGSSASLFGSKAFANGSFSNPGDAQHGVYVLRNITTDNTLTELFLDGSSTQLVLPVNSVFVFDILVAGRRTDAVGGGAGYRFTGVARRDTTTGSVTFVGTPSKTVLGETDAPWDAALTTDTTTGAIRVRVTGQNAKTIRWVATVQTTEVIN